MKLSALACLLACLLLPAPAEAAWPGKDGAIAFVRKGVGLYGTTDIWLGTRSGQQRRLTATAKVSEGSPAFSPDGRTIAYVRSSATGPDIWLMKSDGSGKRPLVARIPDEEQQPHFFPNGKRIAFAAHHGGRGWGVYSVRRDGTGLRRMAADAFDPAVSPDGRWLAYSMVEDEDGIRLLDLRTRAVRNPTAGVRLFPEDLDFSPDSRRLLFTENVACRPGGRPYHSAIITIELRTRRERILRRDCTLGFHDVVWSPNGKSILFAQSEPGKRKRNHTRLMAMSPEGAPMGMNLFHRRGLVEYGPSWQPRR